MQDKTVDMNIPLDATRSLPSNSYASIVADMAIGIPDKTTNIPRTKLLSIKKPNINQINAGMIIRRSSVTGYMRHSMITFLKYQK